jgi:hypothetical protein
VAHIFKTINIPKLLKVTVPAIIKAIKLFNKLTTIALEIKDKISWMVYYNPPSQTSPQYVTIPLIKAGIPAVVYETYINDSYSFTKEHADEFVSAVDSLQFKS